MKINTEIKGSITVEAAVLLPFIIIAVMSFSFILKVYYTNEILQNALAGACRQMSAYSLLYYKTNAEEVIGEIERLSSSNTTKDTLGDNWLTSSIQEAGKNAADYVRTQLALVPAAKQLVVKQLENSFSNDVDKGLARLNVVNGINGLDFSGSKMLADGRSIDILINYTMRFPFLSGILPAVKLSQTASVCIWAGEEGVGWEEAKKVTRCVWDMTNIKRGQEIRKLQGANLPFNFPVIAKFENGMVTSIKSLNIDEPYYKDTICLERKITGYINKLKEFKGETCGDVSISSWEIVSKELLLIIPETELSSGQQNVIDKCVLNARSKGITLKTIKAYGKQGLDGTTTEMKGNKEN